MFITVFTATFNRAKQLHRVYSSLLAQSYKNFEWVVVDDGSTDETKELIETWKRNNKMEIRYIFQLNQGKHIAFNLGVDLAKGDMLVSVDSDDSILPNALELFKTNWEDLENEKKKNFKGLAFRCLDINSNTILGTPLPSKFFDSDDRNFRLKYKIEGEFIGFNRVDVLKKYPFPILDKRVRFCPENIVWYEMAKQYKTRYIDIPARYYHRDAENSITGKNHNRSFSNYYLWKYYINELSNYMIYSPTIILKGYVGISMDGFSTKRNLKDIMRDCKGVWRKVFVLLLTPLGMFLAYKKGNLLIKRGV